MFLQWITELNLILIVFSSLSKVKRSRKYIRNSWNNSFAICYRKLSYSLHIQPKHHFVFELYFHFYLLSLFFTLVNTLKHTHTHIYIHTHIESYTVGDYFTWDDDGIEGNIANPKMLQSPTHKHTHIHRQEEMKWNHHIKAGSQMKIFRFWKI